MTAPGDAAGGGSTVTRILVLGSITALGSMAIQMFVPALPFAATSLGVGDTAIQMTITVYLVGLACGQLVAGPITDALDHKRVLLVGMILFALGSSVGCLAGSIGMLLAGRLIQALGAAATLVASRTMVGSQGGRAASRDLSLMMSIVMLSPLVAPLAGSAIVGWVGWRGVMAALGIAALVLGPLSWRLLQADPPRAAGPAPVGLLRIWMDLLRDRAFLGNVAATVMLGGGLYVFLTIAPFLLVQHHGVDPEWLGVPLSIVAVGAAGGSLAGGWLAGRATARTIILMGGAAAGLAAAMLAAGAAVGATAVAALIGPMALYAFAGGLIMPNTTVGALARSTTAKGVAASLYGAAQMGGSALFSLGAALLPNAPWSIAGGVVIVSVLLLVLIRAGLVGPVGQAPGRA